ncbi:helix-turn-helix domain-containing protein [Kribbella catacumbae]|uniref:helix-turn-helix domain-containing protein n=1 Tax=Kribbella catacumbae TaxID=460086 RepID=UPI00037F3116|nr:transcriptional regulator [Kribbella catacumbae]
MAARTVGSPTVLVVPPPTIWTQAQSGIAALNSGAGYTALMAGDLGQIIRLGRQALGLDQAELGRLSNASQTVVSRAERGMNTDSVVLANLCKALGLLTNQPGEHDPAYSEDMRRRDLLRNVAAAVAAGMLPSQISEPAHAGRIGISEIEDCWAALRRLQAMEDRQGGGTVYQLTAGIAEHLQQTVGRASYDSSTGNKLREVTAIAAVRAGWQAFDSSRRDSARRWWLEARSLADLGGGADEARVMALAAMAVPAREAGRGHEAIGLARAARQAAGQTAHPKLVSLLAAREAIGHAKVGDTAASVHCMSEARRLLDQGADGNAPAWLSFWGEGDLAVHEMHCAKATSNFAAAERAARDAAQASSPHRGLRNHSIYSAYLGNVLALRGQFDESISITEYVLTAGALAGSQRVASEVRKTATVLAKTDYRPARELVAQVERLVSAA